MKTVPEALKEAASFVRKGHCKKAFARNTDGMSINPLREDAVQWCAIGALTKVTGEDLSPAEVIFAKAVGNIAVWNDGDDMDGEKVAAKMEEVANSYTEEA